MFYMHFITLVGKSIDILFIYSYLVLMYSFGFVRSFAETTKNKIYKKIKKKNVSDCPRPMRIKYTPIGRTLRR